MNEKNINKEINVTSAPVLALTERPLFPETFTTLMISRAEDTRAINYAIENYFVYVLYLPCSLIFRCKSRNNFSNSQQTAVIFKFILLKAHIVGQCSAFCLFCFFSSSATRQSSSYHSCPNSCMRGLRRKR